MMKVGIITSEREYSYYLCLFEKLPYELVKITGVADFEQMNKLIITHQPYYWLENQIEILKIREAMKEWLKENSLLTFGISSIFLAEYFDLFSIELNYSELSVLEESKIYIYPNFDPYSAICLPNLKIKTLTEKAEVISKHKEMIIGVRQRENVGYFFIPTKETEHSLIVEYIK